MRVLMNKVSINMMKIGDIGNYDYESGYVKLLISDTFMNMCLSLDRLKDGAGSISDLNYIIKAAKSLEVHPQPYLPDGVYIYPYYDRQEYFGGICVIDRNVISGGSRSYNIWSQDGETTYTITDFESRVGKIFNSTQFTVDFNIQGQMIPSTSPYLRAIYKGFNTELFPIIAPYFTFGQIRKVSSADNPYYADSWRSEKSGNNVVVTRIKDNLDGTESGHNAYQIRSPLTIELYEDLTGVVQAVKDEIVANVSTQFVQR